MSRPPIPTETLKDILARRKNDPEVLALLWEIWRMRIIAKFAHQFAVSASRHDATQSMMADNLAGMTKDEPAVIEHLAMISELTAKPDKKRV